MSLLRQAEKCLANQKAHSSLNAFVSPLRDSRQWVNRVKDTDLRTKQGMDICLPPHSKLISDSRNCYNSKGNPKSKIDGHFISIKDNICTRDFPTTCASGSLGNFTSPFNATVVEWLEDAGAIISGKTNLDEFGMGSHSINSHFGEVRNLLPDKVEYSSAGGSSGGSATAVATDQCYACVTIPNYSV